VGLTSAPVGDFSAYWYPERVGRTFMESEMGNSTHFQKWKRSFEMSLPILCKPK